MKHEFADIGALNAANSEKDWTETLENKRKRVKQEATNSNLTSQRLYVPNARQVRIHASDSIR